MNTITEFLKAAEIGFQAKEKLLVPERVLRKLNAGDASRPLSSAPLPVRQPPGPRCHRSCRRQVAAGAWAPCGRDSGEVHKNSEIPSNDTSFRPDLSVFTEILSSLGMWCVSNF